MLSDGDRDPSAVEVCETDSRADAVADFDCDDDRLDEALRLELTVTLEDCDDNFETAEEALGEKTAESEATPERDAVATPERLADAESDGEGDREALGRLLVEALEERDTAPDARLDTLMDGEAEGIRDASDDGDADVDARRVAVNDTEPLLVGLATGLRLETCDALPLLTALSPLPIGEGERIALPLRIIDADLRPELVRLAEANDDCEATMVTERDAFAVSVGGADLDASADLGERAVANADSVDANEDDARAAEALAKPLFENDADAIEDAVDRIVAAPVECGEVE